MALVELLLTLAERADEEWEPDLALHLLRAADVTTACCNIDDTRVFGPGSVEPALRERLERAAVQVIENLRAAGYRDNAVCSRAADFQEICRGIERRRALEQLDAWESEMGGAS